MPELQSPNLEFIHVSQDVLMSSLKVTSLGTPSSLHIWDPHAERFTSAKVKPGCQAILLLDGKDKVITQRYAQMANPIDRC
jgi:hypothetical protein